MPCPKRKHTRMRTKMRRSANWRVSMDAISKCPQCNEYKLPHVVCKNCGFYNGELVIPKKEKKSKEQQPPQGKTK